MNNIKIVKRVEQRIGENSYLCINLQTNDAILIDPSTRDIEQDILAEKCNVQAIILTHAHFDHILEVDYFAKKYDIPVFVHEKEGRKLSDPMLNLSGQMYEPIIVETKPQLLHGDRGELTLDGFDLRYEVRDGHSEGNLLIQVNGEPIYFVGDSIFADSIGRYDLPGSDARAHYVSLKKFLEEKLPGNYYSGHGPSFTEQTIETNPVMKQFLLSGV